MIIMGLSTTEEQLEFFLARYGQAAQMGARDPSYLAFINNAGDGALLYKISHQTAVITGDPLCPAHVVLPIIHEFQRHNRERKLGTAIVGASEALADLGHMEQWISMKFGVERFLNPLTNPLLTGARGKRTIQKCRQLTKAGFTLELYHPSKQRRPDLEEEITRIYDNWRLLRNNKFKAQAFMTVYDLRAFPNLMIYAVIRNTEGRAVGFAAMRQIACGFHLDPVVVIPDAPKGIADLLIVEILKLSRMNKVDRISLGFEPFAELEDIRGMAKPMALLARGIHHHIFKNLRLSGKHLFHQRFHPDASQDSAIHIVFLKPPGIRTSQAVLHFANINISQAIKASSSATREPDLDK